MFVLFLLRLYEELVTHFVEDYLMQKVMDIVSAHLIKYKKIYTYYCCNQIHQDRMLKNLQ